MGKVCNAFCGLSAGAAWILCSILSTSAGCEGDAASKKILLQTQEIAPTCGIDDGQQSRPSRVIIRNDI